MANVLVDTNVLVYACDPSEGKKHERALQLLTALEGAGAGCLSAQVLSEFLWATTRGRSPLLTVGEATAQMERLAASWPVLDITAPVVLEAAVGVSAHRFSYWDGLIWAAARLNQVPLVLSEDFSHGSRVGGVRFVNPFTPTFDLGTVVPR